MRVLFSSTSGYGHILPMVPLAQAFQSAGHEVLWATGAKACAIVEAAGLRTAPAGLSGEELGERLLPLGVLVAEVHPPERAAFVFPRMFGGLFAAPMLADLLPLATNWLPDLLIHEHGELAAPLVGRLLGRPTLTHAFGSAIPEAFLAEAGETVAPLWAQHGLELPQHAGCFDAPYLDICPPSVQSVPTAHIAQIQPLRPVPVSHDDEALPDYLDDDDARPLVYVTLGTVHNRAPFLRPMVEALAALPVRLLVTVGRDGDPTALGEQPANVRVEHWVDQPQVLRHCSLVVSHAGSGTFFGALAQGLPQLCLPQAADQFRNAGAGVGRGAALSLPPGCSPEEVVLAVQQLLADDGFRTGAAVIAAEIAAMPSAAEVVAILQGWMATR